MALSAKILQEAEDDILNQKIKNPETGRDIKVLSALGYDDKEPVKQKALKLVQQAPATELSFEDGKKAYAKNIPYTEDNGDDWALGWLDAEENTPITTTTAVKSEPAAIQPETDKKSHKPKSNSYGISKEAVAFLASKGLKHLNVYPQSFVKISDIKFNPKLNDNNKDKIWVVKFPVILPNGVHTYKTAYTANFMKKSQIKKYKKISKIKDTDIISLEEKTQKLLQNKNKVISDCGAIIAIILKTGLRVGSQDSDQGTGNLGVRTLKRENFQIIGNLIKLNFIGKGYQTNIAQFEDADIANYLRKTLEGKKDSDNAFDASYAQVGQVMRKINPKGINPKDLRTYNATLYAKNLLSKVKKKDLPKNPKDLKKTVKGILKSVSEQVAKMLNNSPGMARGSYISPWMVKDFLDDVGLMPKDVAYKHVALESLNKNQMTLLEVNFGYKDDEEIDSDISDQDSDGCEEYLWPDWFHNDNIELHHKELLGEGYEVNSNGDLDYTADDVDEYNEHQYEIIVEGSWEYIGDYQDIVEDILFKTIGDTKLSELQPINKTNSEQFDNWVEEEHSMILGFATTAHYSEVEKVISELKYIALKKGDKVQFFLKDVTGRF